jgi:hypothetical protein
VNIDTEADSVGASFFATGFQAANQRNPTPWTRPSTTTWIRTVIKSGKSTRMPGESQERDIPTNRLSKGI